MTASDDWEAFLRGELDTYPIDLNGGYVRVTASEGETRCSADWGGWTWIGEGGGRDSAFRRLETRLERLNPFHGADTDWGDPGFGTGSEEDLDDSIPEGMRKLMMEHHVWSEERGSDEIGAMMDRAHRAREFERQGE